MNPEKTTGTPRDFVESKIGRKNLIADYSICLLGSRATTSPVSGF